MIRLCCESPCGKPVTYRGRCQRHQRTRNRETHRNREVYNAKRWRVLRRRVLFDQPLCSCGEVASDVDHVVAIEDGGAVWERANLEALCKSCHSRKTRVEQR